ncbi:aminodeoxychorismate synthase component I [Halobacillus karajensis]|uniref:Para-aminobenzoate synthase component 1 n=1 Tax=Halobacillus karajensis TaxID=195088 RepID=A0A059NZ48_9BACI|nr:aminodeoxychorismate synthase component I [Halobacillus karajensis]CDQ18656.1 Para-aminobenzoate synthase component 1 [Halobacillus karajensis]CDQ23272.1 Para-aminobenzoate synthase component 1 [Halobacillus karajensis]CDQ26754.1 Para-aminobenzoate synthase component 1 [Halobacillus karajensis]
MTDSPFLLFEFADANGRIAPKTFKNPVEILKTDDIQEVKSIFHRVELRLNEGYYVAGYVSYEAAPAFDQALTVHHQPDWPLLWFGVFRDPEVGGENRANQPFHVSKWEIKGDFGTYQEGIKAIKTGIERGDTYQVNFTTRMEATFSGDDYALYKKLARNQKSSYSAYLNMGEHRLLSASPELFFRVDGNTVKTKPMKGTAGRGRFTKEDEKQRQHLLTSNKEQSENLMIVDLLRNDLGRIAVPGSVHVPKLFEVETYPTVHQMTSTVEGQLPESFTMYDLFQSLFPCGSITGAPKVRTMEYIRRLEESPREVYCGAIGYMTPGREAVFNVPIRTVMINQTEKKAIYGTGGGITWDSTSEGEFEELQTKAQLLTEDRPDFKLLETMKLERGSISRLESHLDRLMASAEYFSFQVTRSSLIEKCRQTASTYPEGRYKIRMLVEKNGEVDIEVSPMDTPVDQRVVGCLALEPIDHNDPFLFHKTTYRSVYNQRQLANAEATLLWNQRGELTEFTVANLVVKLKGQYYTPPVNCGLLAGTYRGYLLRRGDIKEKILFKKDISRFEEIWMINAVRGWVRIDGVEDTP